MGGEGTNILGFVLFFFLKQKEFYISDLEEPLTLRLKN